MAVNEEGCCRSAKQIVPWYLMRVHVYKAEAFASGRFATDQSDVPLIQVGIGIQCLQNHLNSGGVLQIFNDHC